MTTGPLAIGIDLGGTQLRAALVDGAGTILARAGEKTAARAGPAHILEQITGLVATLVPAADLKGIVGIGLSTPGPVDTVTGIASDIPTLSGFAGFPLKAALQSLFPYPVALENDGIAAAIGEWRHGAGRGLDNLVYMTVSTGIGGGIIADGRVLRGRKGMAGHIGHMVLVPDGEPCLCGNRGCFEAYGSGTAFAARARRAVLECRETGIGRDGAAIDSESVFAAARLGDALADRLIDEEGEILARGICNLIHIFSPDRVVLGGGLSQEFERLRPVMQAHISAHAMPAFRDIPVVRAALGGNSGLVGAAALAFLAGSEGQAGGNKALS